MRTYLKPIIFTRFGNIPVYNLMTGNIIYGPVYFAVILKKFRIVGYGRHIRIIFSCSGKIDGIFQYLADIFHIPHFSL